MALQEYRGISVAISYDADVCTHTGNCVRNVPGIFNIDDDPWDRP